MEQQNKYLISDTSCRKLGNHVACFCVSTGNTHVFDVFTGTLIEYLANSTKPQTLSEIAAEMAVLAGTEMDTLLTRIEDTLRVLTAERLVSC